MIEGNGRRRGREIALMEYSNTEKLCFFLVGSRSKFLHWVNSARGGDMMPTRKGEETMRVDQIRCKAEAETS